MKSYCQSNRPSAVKRSWALSGVLIVLTVLAMACGGSEPTLTPTPIVELMQAQLGDTHKVSAAISVGKAPFGIAVTADGKSAYVTTYEDNTVSIFSTASLEVIKVISVDKLPGGIAVSPDGKFVYVGHFDADAFAVISTATQEVVDMFDVGGELGGIMVISPDGTTIYVSHFPGAGRIIIISTVTKKAIREINVRPSLDIAIAPDGERLYVVDPMSEELVQISTANYEVVGRIPLGQDANDFTQFAVSPDGDLVYVPVDNLVTFVSMKSEEVVGTIEIGSEALGTFSLNGIAVSPDGKYVYVANGDEDSVVIISTETNSVADSITVGRGPGTIVVSPDGSAIYVANSLDGSVSVITRE